MYDRELDILTAPDSRQAFSIQEEQAYQEIDSFDEIDFLVYGFDVGGEG